MDSKDLSIVIVTFKSEGKIFNCIDSIPDNIEVIVVENSNNQNFKNIIENRYQNVKCILTGNNKGYAVANNIGLNRVKSKYALVLNPDTTLAKNAVDNFLITAKKLKDFWLIGPINHQSIKNNLENNEIVEVSNLKGFAIFFNIKKFENNFFDENFFLYFEEIDLCKKVKKNKGKIYLDMNININHVGGSSVDKTNKQELEKSRNWHWMWSTFYFHQKYKGTIIALMIILPKFLSSVIKTIFYQLVWNKEKRDIYYCRMSGILNSILGKKSWFRPSLD
jgi:N-acetylglucosaminyl-diphospho-decaprenol L-rhamnosyltransferase